MEKEMQYKCSIIIPFFNMERKIEKSINSIFNDKLRNDIEIIFVDDGSVDCSYEVVNSRISHNNVQLIRLKHAGVSAARNIGLDAAKGKYVFFLDADDEIFLDALYEMIDFAENNNCDVVLSNYYSNDIRTGELKKIACPIVYNTIYDHDFVIKKFFCSFFNGEKVCFPTTSNKLYKLGTIRRNNISFPENMSQAEDLVFNVAFFDCVERLSAVDVVVFKYNLDGSQKDLNKYNVKLPDSIIGWAQCIQNINRKYDLFVESSSEYIRFCSKALATIIVFLKIKQIRDKQKRCFLHNEVIQSILKTLCSLNRSQLLKNGYSIKDKIALILIKHYHYKIALKILKGFC